MRIHFVRTGGFAGLRLSVTLDTEDLPAEEATRIRGLVETSRFFELEQAHVRAASAPDRYEYRLEVSSQVWGQHSLVLMESSIPDDLRPLLAHLTTLAKQGTHRDPPDGEGSA